MFLRASRACYRRSAVKVNSRAYRRTSVMLARKKKKATTLELTERIEGDTNVELHQSLIREIERTHGEGSLVTGGALVSSGKNSINFISTGSLALDMALGSGGFPTGRITEIYGPEASGKTSIALSAIASAQKSGGTCCFIDAEHALDSTWARKLGVDVDNLLICQPDCGEQALDICETLVKSGKMDVICVDSVAALVPKAELEGNMGESSGLGLQARMMSQAMRKLTAAISRQRTLIIFINQIRMKIGVMFGSPETTTGGTALKYSSSVRLDVRRAQSLKKADTIYGNTIRVKVAKNKVGPPYRIAEFDIEFDRGINKEAEILDVGVKLGSIKKNGNWFQLNYGDNTLSLGHGKEKAKAYLVEHPDVREDLELEIREQMKNVRVDADNNEEQKDENQAVAEETL